MQYNLKKKKKKLGLKKRAREKSVWLESVVGAIFFGVGVP